MARSNENDNWSSEFEQRHQSRTKAIDNFSGEARAARRAILQVLAHRNIEVGPSVREQLSYRASLSTLDELLARALEIDAAEQLFQ